MQSTGGAVRVAAELDACGVTWFEEPVSSQDLDGLAAIRRQVRPDVTAVISVCSVVRLVASAIAARAARDVVAVTLA